MESNSGMKPGKEVVERERNNQGEIPGGPQRGGEALGRTATGGGGDVVVPEVNRQTMSVSSVNEIKRRCYVSRSAKAADR